MKPPRWSIIPHAIRKSCDMKTYENHLRESVTSNVIVVFPFVTNVIVQYSKRRQSIYLSYLIWSNLIQSIYLSIYPSIHLFTVTVTVYVYITCDLLFPVLPYVLLGLWGRTVPNPSSWEDSTGRPKMRYFRPASHHRASRFAANMQLDSLQL